MLGIGLGIVPRIELDIEPRIALGSSKGIVLEKLGGKLQCCVRDSFRHVDISST